MDFSQFSQYHFFAIDFVSLNLFSFMMGATWAFFNQGLFGKRIGLWVFLYFGGLAAWYGINYYILLEKTGAIK
jgi:hypothetical protein